MDDHDSERAGEHVGYCFTCLVAAWLCHWMAIIFVFLVVGVFQLEGGFAMTNAVPP
jgi:hypothetical protein